MSGSWDFGGDVSRPGSSSSGWDDAAAAQGARTPTSGNADRQDSTRGSSSAWNDSAPPGSADGTGRATLTGSPVLLLVVPAVLVVAALVVPLVARSWLLSTVAWLLGGPLAILALAAFVQLDVRRRSEPWYSAAPWTDWARRSLIVLSLIAVTANAYVFADHFARR